MMRLAVALGGTDRGMSGIGVYVRSVLPHLAARLAADGGALIALGTQADLDAYALDGMERATLSALYDSPSANALVHLLSVGSEARRAGADVLLLPAANRRMTLLSPVPTVAVVHDLAQLKVARKYDPLRMVYVNHVLTRTLRSARELVAVSRATRDDMAEALRLPADRIRVVPNGVDFNRFSPAAEGGDARVERARAHAGLTGPYVLYAARLEHPGKNHLRLLRAFARSRARDTHVLALAGKDWGAEGLIRAEIEALGLGSRVRLLGFVPDEVLPGLVAGADAVVMVGLHEGFGLPALEALSAGRSLVASSSGALPEVVGSLAASCDPLDEGSIKEALERALGDEGLRARVRLEGPTWARRFGWDATADGLYEACVAALGRRSPGDLLPRAPLGDVLRGRAPLVGSRLDARAPRGFVSPVESRVHLGIPYGDLASEEARLLGQRSMKRDAGVVLRAAVSAALRPSGSMRSVARPRIVSARVNNVTIEEALEAIVEGGTRMVHFVHPHALNLAAFDKEHAARLARADLVLPDGIGIRVAAAMLGVAMRHNLNGTDLLPLLCERAANRGVPLALVGAAPGVAEACAERLKEATPGLKVALVSHGFLDEAASLRLAEQIKRLGRSIVLIGMGSPLQERWAWQYLGDAPEATVLTVGGLFDFFSGRVPRAPVWCRELGLEWAFRLSQEPRRLAKRYLVGNPLFLMLAARQRVSGAPVE